MYQEISQLLMYGDLDEDSILAQMGEVFGKYETGEYNKTGLVRDINTQVKRILKVATDYGFDIVGGINVSSIDESPYSAVAE